MRDLLVQWALRSAREPERFDAEYHRELPRKPPPPLGGQASRRESSSHLSRNRGWVTSISCQGFVFSGYDGYAIQHVSTDECVLIGWNDNPNDWRIGTRYAYVSSFRTLAQDPALGGSYNTRQTITVYADPGSFEWTRGPRTTGYAPVEMRTYEEFVPIRDQLIRNGDALWGVWTPNSLDEENRLAREAWITQRRGWRFYTQGVPLHLIHPKTGLLIDQLPAGFNQPKGTKTVYQRSTDLATGVHTASDHEDELNATAGTGATESVSYGDTTARQLWVFSSQSGFPNNSQWPTGAGAQAYEAQLDVHLNDGSYSYGLMTIGGVAGHFGRVDSGLTGSTHETHEQTQSAFTGQGLKLASYASTWSAGNSSDRVEIVVVGQRGDSHGTKSLGLTFDSDGFVRGPWNNQFSQNVAGTLSFSGVNKYSVTKKTAGTLSFSGALVRSVNKTVSGALSFVGALTADKLVLKTVTGALSFSGALSQMTTKAVSGVLSFVGVLVLLTTKSVSGSVSFAGDLTTLLEKPITGQVSFSGALVFQTAKLAAGALGFSGALIKSTGYAVAGALSFSGALIKSTGYAVAGALSFVGALTADKLVLKTVTGALSFSGALVLQTTKLLSGTLDLAGAVLFLATKLVAGVLGFSGVLTSTKVILKDVAGSLSFAGVNTLTVTKLVAGVLGFSGTILVQVSTSLIGSLSFTGSLAKSATKAVSGTLSFTGALTSVKLILKNVAGSLSFAGVSVYSTTKSLVGALTFAGALSKRTLLPLTGALTFAGALSAIKLTLQSVTGSLGFSGAVTYSTYKVASGALTFTGDLSETLSKTIVGVLNFTGILTTTTGAITKIIEGTISFSGLVSSRISLSLSGALSFVGGLSTLFQRGVLLGVSRLRLTGQFVRGRLFQGKTPKG